MNKDNFEALLNAEGPLTRDHPDVPKGRLPRARLHEYGTWLRETHIREFIILYKEHQTEMKKLL